ncbi:MAG: hypothetical protein U0794_18250 [Isosphaeraceae bacterium]
MAGVATFQVATHTDPFLELEFPSNATPLWSVVNQLGTLPRRTPGGNWQVPLVDNGRNRVTILWKPTPRPRTLGLPPDRFRFLASSARRLPSSCESTRRHVPS